MPIENILPIANAPPLQPAGPINREGHTLEMPQDPGAFSSLMALLFQQLLATPSPENPAPPSIEISGDTPLEGLHGTAWAIPQNEKAPVPIAPETSSAQSDIDMLQNLPATTNAEMPATSEPDGRSYGGARASFPVSARSIVLSNAAHLVVDHVKFDPTVFQTEEAPVEAPTPGVTLEQLPEVLAEAIGLAESQESDSVFPQILHAVAALETSEKVSPKLGIRQGSQPDILFVVADPDVSGVTGSTHRHDVPPAPTMESGMSVNWAKYVAAPLRQSFVLHLEPETLGEVRIDVTRVRGDISVKMVTAMNSGKEALAAHVHTLQEALLQQGLPVSQITIETGLNVGANGWHGAGHQLPASHPPVVTPSTATGSAEEISVPQGSAKSRHTGSLDLYV